MKIQNIPISNNLIKHGNTNSHRSVYTSHNIMFSQENSSVSKANRTTKHAITFAQSYTKFVRIHLKRNGSEFTRLCRTVKSTFTESVMKLFLIQPDKIQNRHGPERSCNSFYAEQKMNKLNTTRNENNIPIPALEPRKSSLFPLFKIELSTSPVPGK